MASSDNGKQHITFHYQQEGTAKGLSFEDKKKKAFSLS